MANGINPFAVLFLIRLKLRFIKAAALTKLSLS